MLAVAIALLTVPGLPGARDAGAETASVAPAGPHWFDIPTQPLAAALEAYSRRTGRMAAYNGTLATGRSSHTVQGTLDADEALDLLLRDTGLQAVRTTETTFVVVPEDPRTRPVTSARAVAAAALARQTVTERRYSGVLQAAVNDVLCLRAVTRPGGYRLAVSFWITPSGGITTPRLLGSTGSPERDAAVLGALRSASVGEAPPPRMAQPFTILLLPQPPGARTGCPSLEASQRHG
ncbi:TonB family protein [Rhodoplanes sp. TEM]|uniref:TonB family protein n=1 Tax=Rhodoplanes tepidamans TaxID=200616 RepID=A0ABT5JBH1_RHOTP|nr:MULTISPECIES: TonB family protein [Rhodoplanes]MDC7787033.1 TonB family protein [Rhodoplanes tepidamans]MDC7985269.1 TonB family protein [Rhodoplanes sp. TEM]MDQ0354241.1 TonB family protein [Rhodoplanes tepidamans]